VRSQLLRQLAHLTAEYLWEARERQRLGRVDQALAHEAEERGVEALHSAASVDRLQVPVDLVRLGFADHVRDSVGLEEYLHRGDAPLSARAPAEVLRDDCLEQ